MVGVKFVLVGAVDTLTVKGALLVAQSCGSVTEIVPVVAPAGHLGTICVVDAETTLAVTPI